MTSKGITPVIATVLLMTITVGATVSAFTFMNGLQNELREGVEEKQNDQKDIDQSDINIETAYNGSDGHIIANVRNTGSITLDVLDRDGDKLFNAFIDNEPIGGDGTGWEFRGSSKDSISPQEHVVINTTEKFPNPNSEKLVDITGPNEVSDSTVCYNSGVKSC